MRESINARKVDNEFKKEREMRMKKFRRTYCNACKNKHTDLCHITIDLDNKLKCVEFEEE